MPPCRAWIRASRRSPGRRRRPRADGRQWSRSRTVRHRLPPLGRGGSPPPRGAVCRGRDGSRSVSRRMRGPSTAPGSPLSPSSRRRRNGRRSASLRPDRSSLHIRITGLTPAERYSIGPGRGHQTAGDGPHLARRVCPGMAGMCSAHLVRACRHHLWRRVAAALDRARHAGARDRRARGRVGPGLEHHGPAVPRRSTSPATRRARQAPSIRLLPSPWRCEPMGRVRPSSFRVPATRSFAWSSPPSRVGWALESEYVARVITLP